MTGVDEWGKYVGGNCVEMLFQYLFDLTSKRPFAEI
jgi:hypothetical protein